MAWRFKASKYRNTVPVVPKPENCIRDITIGSYQIYGNSITASAAFMAFNIGQNGSNLAVFHLDDCGRKGKDMALLHAHIDTVTDMDFSPFHDGLLATGSQDCLIKVWHIPEVGLEANLSDPECVLYSKTQRRVETVSFHPVADCLLSTSSYTELNLWDITTQQSIYSSSRDHTEVIQCINWNDVGSLLATTCKDKRLRILDCRKDNSVVHEVVSHQGIKDSRVVWLNDGFRLLSTGFSATRQREIFIRDIRNLKEPEKNVELDSSTGILLPLYDPDTNMLFLAGKGDTSILYVEVTNRPPHLIEGLRHNGEQTKGACLVPKRALKVMQGEVNRVLQLTSTMVIPIMYQVPRKTYRDFHADLYPDTVGCVTDLSPSEWIAGRDKVLDKISLDPSKRDAKNDVLHRGSLQDICLTINKREPKTDEEKEVSNENEKTEEPELKFDAIKKKFDESCSMRMKNPKPVLKTEKLTTPSSEAHDGEGKAKNFETEIPPPKPKPRSTRSNSIDIVEERPVAKPRTHKYSIDLGHGFITPDAQGLMEKVDEEEDPPSLVAEKSQPCVIQSVNPNLPVSGGYKPRLGPKPFTPPKLQRSYSSAEKVLSTEQSATLTCEAQQDFVDTSPRNVSTANRFGVNQNDVTVTCDLDKLSMREDGVSDLITAMEGGKIGNSTQSFSNEMRNKSKERNFDCGDGCEKIVESFEKHLTKVANVGESRDNHKKEDGTGSPVLDEEASISEFGKRRQAKLWLGPMGGGVLVTNVHKTKKKLPAQCDGFHANWERAAVPGSGKGIIAVYELYEDVNQCTILHNKAEVNDFCWNPFDDSTLVVACDNRCVNIWTISKADVGTQMHTPSNDGVVNYGNVVCMKFHPLIKNMIAMAHDCGTVAVYNLNSISVYYSIHGTFLSVLCLSWSPLGDKLALATHSGYVAMVNVLRHGTERFQPVELSSSRVPYVKTNVARMAWVSNGEFLILVQPEVNNSGFLRIYNTISLKWRVFSLRCLSPYISTPLYDEATSILMIPGKDSSYWTSVRIDTVDCREWNESNPTYDAIWDEHNWEFSSIHRGLTFLSRKGCDVSSLEYIRVVRLTSDTIECWGYKAFCANGVKVEDFFNNVIATWLPGRNIQHHNDFQVLEPMRVNLFTGNLVFKK